LRPQKQTWSLRRKKKDTTAIFYESVFKRQGSKEIESKERTGENDKNKGGGESLGKTQKKRVFLSQFSFQIKHCILTAFSAV
jgi:hypothetical protein